MASEKSTREICVGGVHVTIVKKRVKNVNFRVRSDGTASMSVPWHISWAQAEELARGREDWFVAHVGRVVATSNSGTRRLETGDMVPVWGTLMPLRVENGASPRRCEATDNALVLHVLPGDDSDMRFRVLDAWYKVQLYDRLEELRPVCEARVGKRATSISLRRMTTRWGSCTASTGRIRLNVALAEYAPECLEMVLVHELCHLIVANHGPRFYALMDLNCPGWRAAKRKLDARIPEL